MFSPGHLDKIYISGKLTSEDWKKLKFKIEKYNDLDTWAEAYNSFLWNRLNTRYLSPIGILQKHGNFEGEGYSIVSIQCALIEFIAALRVGKSYVFSRNPQNNEYSRSKDLYINFLSKAPIFKDFFDEESALEFYVSIRCALLHEACTKNGWRIWAFGDIPINSRSKIVFREKLHDTILTYLENYKAELLKNPEIQSAFIRKFDSLCE
ncbi:hypothetical protein [Thalassospira sp.]|uniref:hypothetical protein n=1 Tax=Thalassospira sp. TaxID=1912094 RepID=UPI002733B091|nr:hypothetical protein [Thalassospira sp.]MDP2696793.1 hypothetical protein [Thalassospira sp.]